MEPAGAFTELDGEPVYRISAFHRLPPFLINLPSDTDLWMYVASSGGLTAGRTDPDGSLFPYETVDRLFDAHHHTGPVTLIRVRRDSREVIWEPFAEAGADDPEIERNLYRNPPGNRLTFEEIHHGLGLGFRHGWSMCDEFGLVRTAALENRGDRWAHVAVLDGLRNILPFGAPLRLYQQSSCLVDAYKRADYDPESRLAIYSLTARITDRPEPAEELRAATVFCHGLPGTDVALSIEAIAAFRRGAPVAPERRVTGRRGNYLAIARLELEPGKRQSWRIAADTRRSHAQVVALRERLLAGADVGREIAQSLDRADRRLFALVANADGVQSTADAAHDMHHFANVLFNIMRGGVFLRNYEIRARELADFVRVRSRAMTDTDLERLSCELLPLHFGRRHGDPSRPWNLFSIRVRDAAGRDLLHHEGNWRDIFQNWEALGASFPGFLTAMIARFVNASTVDGFNPYRVTADGIDWEVPDPADPWGHIGYWGDHQIVYLLRLLEAARRTSPEKLKSLLRREIFCYADVPYRLKPYREMVADPRATIVFDRDRAAAIDEKVRRFGTDGKLVHDSDGRVRHVNLLEKLLVPALSKLGSLVPDAGIWMNTQRPEWNDANNALAGNGASLVTLCHLRRYLDFLARLVEEEDDAARSSAASEQGAPGTFTISWEVAGWLRETAAILEEKRGCLAAGTVSDHAARDFLDAVGTAFSKYRDSVYPGGPTGGAAVTGSEVVAFCRAALQYLDHAIAANRRPDGLYHSYNLVEFTEGGLRVRRLYEMLEGQVAVLSSGVIGGREAVPLLENLFASRIYCPERKSFLLYPARELPAWLDRNRVPEELVRSVPLLARLVAYGETSIIERDRGGTFRFNGDLGNARELSASLDRLAEWNKWRPAVERDRQRVLDVWETVFDHRSFTGRSGTMYAYEGLGCVYWHMVAKLLLAVQEVTLAAGREGEDPTVIAKLTEYYGRIRAGLGFNRKVSEFGAFPTDPYSHSPAGRGAQQPGMTGQVKEEILTRFGELGVSVEDGLVSFRPRLLRKSEFRRSPGTFRFVDVDGTEQHIAMPAESLAFTWCQVPVLYRLAHGTAPVGAIRLVDIDGSVRSLDGSTLDSVASAAIMGRHGTMARVEVDVPAASLLS